MEPMDDRTQEELYRKQYFNKTQNFKDINKYLKYKKDIEDIANYIVKLYPTLVTKYCARGAAQKLLDKGITADAVLSGSFDKYIHNYIDDLKEMIDELLETFYISESDAIKILNDLSNIYIFDINDLKSEKMKEEIASTYDIIPKEIKEESVKIDNEATEILLRVQKKKKSARIVAMVLCGIGIVGAINYSYKEGKREIESKKTRKELTTIADLDVKTGTFIEQSRISSEDRNVYDFSRMASFIIKGCQKDSKLFDYYIYDTYKNFVSSKNNSDPIMMMDNLMDELKNQLESNEELGTIYEKIVDCDCFLEYLYKQGFISHTDKDYFSLQDDIERYKIIKISGVINPLESTYFPEESKIRIKKLLNSFTSMKYDAALLNEFKDDIDDILSGGRS